MGLVADILKQIPSWAMPFIAKFAPELKTLTPNQISILDENVERVIDAIGARDYETVAAFIEQYHIKPEGKAGQIIMRLMGEPVKVDDGTH